MNGEEDSMSEHPPPVLDDWDGYVFPEQSLPPGNHRMMVRDPVSPATAGSFAPARLDEPEVSSAAPGAMKHTLLRVSERLRDPESVTELALHGHGNADVRWFLFSPYEVFLERVLAERLKTLEPGELR